MNQAVNASPPEPDPKRRRTPLDDLRRLIDNREHPPFTETKFNVTPGTFHPCFLLHAQGGRSDPIMVGRGGNQDLVRKRYTYERHCRSSLCLAEKCEPVTGDGSPNPRNNALENLALFQNNRQALKDNHVVHVEYFLRTDETGDGCTLTTFMPWYSAGSLRDFTRWCKPRPADLYGVLHDAWVGLLYLNGTLGVLHYDIKPGARVPSSHDGTRAANVFVRREGDRWVGCIGDIDDVILKRDCTPQGADIQSTPCYGAPFEHCVRSPSWMDGDR